MKRIAVIGTGYVGLVSGAMFASVGNRVTCVDKDSKIVDALQAGKCTIHEPGLEDILESAIQDGRLSFTTGIKEAVHSSQATLIAVGTPSLPTGAYDFQYVQAAALEVGRALSTHPGTGRTPHIVVLKSTITPDIYTRVQQILEQETSGSGVEFELVSNPEFLAEGTAVRDFSQPHRIIVGAVSPAAKTFMQSLYGPFTKRNSTLLQITDPKSAIVAKLAANSFLACRVALINEVARYCDSVGADIESVRAGLAADPRIGQLFLYAGPGYGGSCFGKDIRALRESAHDFGADLSLVPAIEDSNCRHKLYLPKSIESRVSPLQGSTVAVWGLAFKARTDDIRESPSIACIEYLLERGARIHAHDPEAAERARGYFGSRIDLFDNKYDAVRGASALVIVTEWDAYKSPDYYELSKHLQKRLVVDARNILDPDEVQRAGLLYVGMGRRSGLGSQHTAAD